MNNFFGRLIRVLFTTVLLQGCCIFLLQGCYGGGTIGTGLSTGFGGSRHPSGVSFTLVGTIKDTKGKVLSDATVEIVTTYGTVVRKSNANGIFRSPITIGSGEYITVDVLHDTVKFHQKQQLSPAGAREVYQTFIVDREHSR